MRADGCEVDRIVRGLGLSSSIENVGHILAASKYISRGNGLADDKNVRCTIGIAVRAVKNHC